MDLCAGQGILRLRTRGVAGSWARVVADAQGNCSDDRDRIRVSRGDGFVLIRCGYGIGMDRQASDWTDRGMSKKWYVVHAYSGFEKSVQRTLTERIKRSDLVDQFGKILVPVEEVVEMKAGQKAISERKFFPGYVLVEMEMTDDTWHLVKSTPKVTGFVGGTANKPTPISQKEVDAILQQVQEGVEKPRPKVLFELGEADPSPPIGPALGQRGLNIMEFCKAFNAQTQGVEPGLPVPVIITAYADKSFTFIMKTPPATVLIKKAAKVDKGSAKPNADKVGKLTRAQAEEIAKVKHPDLTAADLDAAVRTIAGSARSMGITVEGVK